MIRSLAIAVPLGAAPLAAASVEPTPTATVMQLLDGWRAADLDRSSATLAPQFRLLALRKGEQDPDSRSRSASRCCRRCAS